MAQVEVKHATYLLTAVLGVELLFWSKNRRRHLISTGRPHVVYLRRPPGYGRMYLASLLDSGIAF